MGTSSTRKRKRPATREPEAAGPASPAAAAADAGAPAVKAAVPDYSAVVSWNICSMRTLCREPLNGQPLRALATTYKPGVIFLSETKLQQQHVTDYANLLHDLGYRYSYWHCSVARKGYSGTALYARQKPSQVSYGLIDSDLDQEGRVITALYPKVVLVGTYVPNSGQGLKRLRYRLDEWEPAMRHHLATLRQRHPGVPVVLTGDLNVAPEAIDIHAPKQNLRSAGFTVEEREAFKELLGHGEGWVDAFRMLYPEAAHCYTYWSRAGKDCRGENKGWRLDHFVVSQAEAAAGKIADCRHLTEQMGSDHCPVALDLALEEPFAAG